MRTSCCDDDDDGLSSNCIPQEKTAQRLMIQHPGSTTCSSTNSYESRRIYIIAPRFVPRTLKIRCQPAVWGTPGKTPHSTRAIEFEPAAAIHTSAVLWAHE